ncbi:hypothetical protein HDV02_003663, partial [Globomyces sp. JEL0801]
VVILDDERVIDPSAGRNYAIKFASESGYTEMVKLLLQDEQGDPSADKCFAIRRASINGHTKIVKLLKSVKRSVYLSFGKHWVRVKKCNIM